LIERQHEERWRDDNRHEPQVVEVLAYCYHAG
jgi:hypothetical protein